MEFAPSPNGFIVDTDLNFPSDDAQALILLLMCAGSRVRGISACAGNTFAEEALVNVAALCGLLQRWDVPLAAGAHHSRFSTRRDVALKDAAQGRLPFVGSHAKNVGPRFGPQAKRADDLCKKFHVYDSLSALLDRQPDPVDIICLGPLTNLSDTLAGASQLREKISSVWSMSGCLANSVEKPRFEFNVWYDPLSAAAVYRSGLPILLFSYDLTRRTRCSAALIEALTAKPSDGAGHLWCTDFLNLAVQHGPTMPLCDQLVAAAYLDPDIVLRRRPGSLLIECEDGDLLGFCREVPSSPFGLEIVTEVDTARLTDFFTSFLRLTGSHPRMGAVSQFLQGWLYSIDGGHHALDGDIVDLSGSMI
ncbi:MAG TPA: nucleoside hydrolase [Allosphingosinicella sp.]|nr:nucleoside hydrolase [Allosphingosinicella sp.]